MKNGKFFLNKSDGTNPRIGLLALWTAVVLLLVGYTVNPFSSQTKNIRPATAPIIDGIEGYDVIVAGGEPEGVAAALSAARNGMKTLLVEEADSLGGLMTLGM